MRLQLLLPLLLVLACKNKSHQEAKATQLTTPSTKADTTEIVSSNRFEKFKSADYKIHTRQTIGDYTISIWQNRATEEPPYFLMIENKSTRRKDTLQLTNISTLQDRKVEMDDLTKKVALPPLTLARQLHYYRLLKRLHHEHRSPRHLVHRLRHANYRHASHLSGISFRQKDLSHALAWHPSSYRYFLLPTATD